jgi:hypothetical protein
MRSMSSKNKNRDQSLDSDTGQFFRIHMAYAVRYILTYNVTEAEGHFATARRG